MKKAFRSVLAFMLVFVIMASVFCTAGVLAASDTVYTAHLHGTGNTTLSNEVVVGTDTTYTVSFRWKSVQGNARVQLSGSAIGGRTVDLIVEGSYPMPGITYDWRNGTVAYTFTTPKDVESDTLVFSVLQYSAEETEFYIGDVKIFESDANGVAVEGGEVIDLPFVNGAYAWTAPDAAYIDYAEQETGFFALESDPNDGVEKLIVFKMPYVFPDAWDARSFNKEVSVDTSKTYTFKMYYKSLSTDNNKADIVVNNTKIVEDGGYNVKNGAVYDGYTGLISYTFKPSNSSIYINMESRKSPPDANNLKDWAIALPQLFESDENGNAVEGGDVVDCDTTFASWNYDGWNGHTTLYSAAGIELGSKDFFITRFPNQQPDDGIYVMNYVEGTDNRNVSYTTTVTPNTEYTFSMYYKDLGNSLACFMVDGTTIIDGGYNVQNGAVYDPYEGKVTYKFTPAGGSVTIAIDSHGKDWHFCNNFRMADPRLVDSDGVDAGCNVDFSEWTSNFWGNPQANQFTVSVGQYSDFPTKVKTHDQPENGIYVMTYANFNDQRQVSFTADVTAGTEYTFSAYYKDLGNNKAYFIVDDTVIIKGGRNIQDGVEYDPDTGKVTYKFTPAGNTVKIAINSLKDEYYWSNNFIFADPRLVDAEGNSANCDVDFCKWSTVWWHGAADNQFTVSVGQYSDFAGNLITGDANADGAFNIADLVAAKKYLSGARSWLSFKALNTTKTDISAVTLATVRRWLLNGAEVLSKQDVMNKLTAAASSKYLLGAHTAGSADVPACADSFSAVMGAAPGYIDVDMHSLPFISGDATNRIVSDVTAYAMQGTGFVTLSAHWLTPTTKIADATLQGANNSRTMLTAEQYNNVMTAGTTENTNFLEELAIDAAFIRKLKDNGISVIFRSMHESNQGYFWWCVNPEQGITAAMYSNLYRYVHDYFTVTCGLDNIIWQFNVDRAGYNAETVAAMYPGDNYVDTVSLDWYLSAGSTATELYDAYTSLMSISGNKPFAIAEFGGYGDYDIYNISFSETLKKIDDACTMGAKIAYVGPYVNWKDIKN